MLRSSLLPVLFWLFNIGLLSAQNFTMVVKAEGKDDRIDAVAPIVEYLEKELNWKIKVVSVPKINDVISYINSGKADFGFISAYGYVIASSQPNNLLEPLIISGTDNKPNTYNSCVIANPKLGLKNLDDLKKNAKQYNFYFVNPTSTSGHILPRLYFSKLGFEQPETAFKSIKFGDNHENTIQQVINETADVAACAYSILLNKIELGLFAKDSIDILWISEDIVVGSMVINKNIESATKNKLQKALIDLNKKDPETWKVIQNKWGDSRNAAGFIVSTDSHYNSIRNSIDKIEDLLFILNYYTD